MLKAQGKGFLLYSSAFGFWLLAFGCASIEVIAL